jgi:hypothetical protein
MTEPNTTATTATSPSHTIVSLSATPSTTTTALTSNPIQESLSTAIAPPFPYNYQHYSYAYSYPYQQQYFHPTTTTTRTAAAQQQQQQQQHTDTDHSLSTLPHHHHQQQQQQQQQRKNITFADIQRFKPRLELEIEPGDETMLPTQQKRLVFSNVKVIANQINRKPRYIMKYLSFAMRRTCFYNIMRNCGFILYEQTIHLNERESILSHQELDNIDFEDLKSTGELINQLLQKYVKSYVQCPKCCSLQTMNPPIQQSFGEEEPAFSIACRECNTVTNLNVKEDLFLQDIVDSRNRNLEKSGNRLRGMRNMPPGYYGADFYEQSYQQEASSGALTGRYPTYFKKINGATYFDVNPAEIIPAYPTYYAPSAAAAMNGPLYATDPYVPYPAFHLQQHQQQHPPPPPPSISAVATAGTFGYNGEYPVQEQPEDGMYTSDALEKEVFEQALQQQSKQQKHRNKSHKNNVNAHTTTTAAAAAATTTSSNTAGGSGNNSRNRNTTSNGTSSGNGSDHNSRSNNIAATNSGKRNIGSILSNQEIESVYKSAGILPYCIHPTTKQLVFLLGKEKRGNGNKASRKKATWSEFGGKKESTDKDSIATAAREFCEETLAVYRGEKMSGTTVNKLNKDSLAQSIQYIEGILRKMNEEELKRQSIYYAQGKYRLFFIPLPYIPAEIFTNSHQEDSQKHVPCAEKQEFEWIEASHLFEIICGEKKKQNRATVISENNLIQWKPNEELHSFFVLLFRAARTIVQRIIKENTH